MKKFFFFSHRNEATHSKTRGENTRSQQEQWCGQQNFFLCVAMCEEM